jgi:hypothetical protein
MERVQASSLEKKHIAHIHLVSIQPEYLNTGLLLLKSLPHDRDITLSLIARSNVASYTKSWAFARDALLSVNPRSEYVCYYRGLVILCVCDLVVEGRVDLAADLAFEYMQTPASMRRGYFAEVSGVRFLLDRFA